MKILLLVFTMLLPVITIAQGYQGMSEADMQRMMQNMQGAAACMQGIDQARLEAFGQRAEKVESEIKALCAKGERDAAQSKGLSFAREVNTDPDMLKMRECGENMRGMMPALQKASPAPLTGEGMTFKSVELPQQMRETRIVKDTPAADVAKEIVEWLKG